jgi:hypothetical protein
MIFIAPRFISLVSITIFKKFQIIGFKGLWACGSVVTILQILQI